MDQLSGNAHSEKKISSEFVGQNPKKTLFSNAPLFVGFNPKSSESDSVRSPTSPLDLRVFSFLGNNPLRSQRSSHEKVWCRNKVGLSIVDSLDFESEHSGKKVIRASDSTKNILCKPQIRTKPMDSKTNTLSYARTDEVTKSLPKYVANPSKKESSNVCFEIGDSSTNLRSFSFDSRQSRSRLSRLSESSSLFCPRSPVSDNSKTDPTSSGPSTCLNLDIPPSEIELSEDYTCVKIHGPNPKVTHIFCDCILECKSNSLAQSKENEKVTNPTASMAYPFCDFLKFCYSCKKNLDGEDIYMYRGEKAFCSSNCRLQVILLDEEMEKSNVVSCDDSSEQKNGSTASLFIST